MAERVEVCADLAVQLPHFSRLKCAINPDSLWGDTERLLWAIEFDLRALMWGLGGNEGKKPKPMPTPSQSNKQINADAAEMDEVRALLGLSIEAVTNGNQHEPG